jgi:hypothetical protein
MRRDKKRRAAPLALALALALALLLPACGPLADDELDDAVAQHYALGPTIPVYPPGAPAFFTLADGTNLESFDASHLLARRTGLGNALPDEQTYRKLKSDSKIHWIVRELDDGKVLAEGATSTKTVYGASVTKAFVVAALLDAKQGKLDAATWQKVYRLLVNSDNSVWSTLEDLAGGKSAVHAFTQGMGYKKTQGYRSGNQINARELSDFLHDIHHLRMTGAEALLKVMSACNTGAAKSRKYLPSTIYLGGKTGTWNQYQHDMRFLELGGKRYAVVVLSEKSRDEDVAVMFGGLAREYLLGAPPPPQGDAFIGAACAGPAACASGLCFGELPGAASFAGGMCSQSCTRLCPDRSGSPETFCVTFDATRGLFEGSQGHCFSRCDTKRYSGDGCRSGYRCVKLKRHNESSVKRNVCVPDDKGDQVSLVGEPADAEGDLPNPEQPPAVGCSAAAGASPASPACLLLLFLLALATRARTAGRRSGT